MIKNEINLITCEELLPLAEKMFNEKRKLVIINGYIDKTGKKSIVYNFDIDGIVETYIVRGENKVPSLTTIYKGSAQWCEEEICEMMGVEFDGLVKSDRLFLPDDFDGSGQILVMPLNELREKNNIE